MVTQVYHSIGYSKFYLSSVLLLIQLGEGDYFSRIDDLTHTDVLQSSMCLTIEDEIVASDLDHFCISHQSLPPMVRYMNWTN